MKESYISPIVFFCVRSVGWIALILILGACSSTPGTDLRITESGDVATNTSNNSERSTETDYFPDLSVDVFIVGEARSVSLVQAAIKNVAKIYEKCLIGLRATLSELPAATDLVVSKEQRYTLAEKQLVTVPSVFVVFDTSEVEVAYAYLPSQRSEVSGTAWLTNRISDACFSWIMAHEIGHIVMDSAVHNAGPKNVMNNNCKSNNWTRNQLDPGWTPIQCKALRESEFTQG